MAMRNGVGHILAALCLYAAAAGPADPAPIRTAESAGRLAQAQAHAFKNKRGWGNKEELKKRRGWQPYANQTKYSDADMGLTEYVGRPQKGLDGVFKWFWGDFRVQEVDRDGQVVFLSDTESLPQRPWPEEDEEDDVIFDLEQLLGFEAGRALQVLLRNGRRKPQATADIAVANATAGRAAQKILTRRSKCLGADVLEQSLSLPDGGSECILRCFIRARNSSSPLRTATDRRHLQFTLAKCG